MSVSVTKSEFFTQLNTVLSVLALMACGGTGNAEIAIHRFHEPGDASVNSFLVEAEEGAILIDAQRTLSAGRALSTMIKETDKPLAAIILTHPHPDHFGGLAAVLDAFPGTPVYASGATLEEMREDRFGFMAATKAAFPGDTPDMFPLPTKTFDDGARMILGGIEIIIDDIGPGKAAAMSMIYVPAAEALFTGDLIAHGMTGFLLEGRSAAWLAQIASVRTDYGAAKPHLYPGHGAPGAFAPRLDWQQGWLVSVRDAAHGHLGDGRITAREARSAASVLDAANSDLPPVAAIPDLVRLNVEAVGEELLTEDRDDPN